MTLPITTFFCPDTSKLKDIYKLKNLKTDRDSTVSVSYQLMYCSSDLNKNCASESDAKQIIDLLSVNTHYLNEATDFFNYDNLHERPIVGDLRLLETMTLNGG